MTDKIYKCLIVDDEPPAREVLRRYVQQLPLLSIEAECTNAVQAMVVLKQQPVDLLFLDIQMPKISGIELIKSMPSIPKVILTTAYEQYALQAFDLDVTDYLLKPIHFDRFLKAVMKALPVTDKNAAALLPQDCTGEPAFLYFRSDRKMVKVYLDKIICIESLKDYVKVRTTQGDVITKHSMAALESILPGKHFIRVHRSFIVALSSVTSFTADRLQLDHITVPVGKLYRMQVLKILQHRNE
ncbi:MAG: LytTR family DNA-binding domain-containing protein [Chitinophagaceae bacterium]